MAKKKSSKNNDFPWGNMTPSGYVAKVATRDGRKTNKTKNIRDGSLF